MGDLTNPKLIYAKGFLFLAGGLLAATGLILENPTAKTVLLLAVAVWCFARFYYFAFYVIEHYVDPGYRFAGLGSFVRHLLARPGRAGPPSAALPPLHGPRASDSDRRAGR
jgi:hypothetical protein